MTHKGTGLGDGQRRNIGLIFTALLTINGSLAGMAAANAIDIPPFVYFALGIASMVIYAIKDQMGIRDATSARAAKEVVAELDNARNLEDSK